MFKKYAVILLALTSMVFATVPDISNTANYSCNGSTTSFAFSFPIPSTDTSQITVILRTVATGEADTLTEVIDYTVSATNNDYSSGGTVRQFRLTAAPMP